MRTSSNESTFLTLWVSLDAHTTLFMGKAPLLGSREKVAEVSHIARTAPVRQQTNAGYCVTVSSVPEILRFSPSMIYKVFFGVFWFSAKSAAVIARYTAAFLIYVAIPSPGQIVILTAVSAALTRL